MEMMENRLQYIQANGDVGNDRQSTIQDLRVKERIKNSSESEVYEETHNKEEDGNDYEQNNMINFQMTGIAVICKII